MFDRSVLIAALTLGVAAPAMAAAQTQAPRPGATTARPAPAAPQAAPTRAALLRNLDANFKRVDANGDGTLTQPEIAAAESRAVQQRAAQIRATVEGQFTKMDTNRDGNLSKAEFMAAAPQPSAAAATGANILAQVDRNKDGKVTPDEYRALPLSRFDRADTNKDGTLSQAERQAAARTTQTTQRR